MNKIIEGCPVEGCSDITLKLLKKINIFSSFYFLDAWLLSKYKLSRDCHLIISKNKYDSFVVFHLSDIPNSIFKSCEIILFLRIHWNIYFYGCLLAYILFVLVFFELFIFLFQLLYTRKYIPSVYNFCAEFCNCYSF